MALPVASGVNPLKAHECVLARHCAKNCFVSRRLCTGAGSAFGGMLGGGIVFGRNAPAATPSSLLTCMEAIVILSPI
ncbi:hypothetical protein D3C72_2188090 [compost metagenome]